MRPAMQVKRPHISPAVSLIGRVTPEAMGHVLRELDSHTAGRWEIARTGTSKTDGAYFVVRYWPVNRPGVWEMVFGINGWLWSD